MLAKYGVQGEQKGVLLQEEEFSEGGLLEYGCVAGMFIHPLKNVLLLC